MIKKKKEMKILFVILIILVIYATSKPILNDLEGIEFLPQFLPKHAGEKYCATEDVWNWKKALIAAKNNETAPQDCKPEGSCDNFGERNRWANRTMHIKLHITVICTNETSCPGNVTPLKVREQVDQINIDFKGTGITFDYNDALFVIDDRYAVLPAYNPIITTWYTRLNELKNKYAVQPENFLNVFITGQTSGLFGTLLGIGTFPWDAEAPTNTGGLWVNAAHVGAGLKTASHEIGHNVGLWHTFHGDSEVACTSDCYETVHQDTADNSISNFVGDFCADTPAQPMNYKCEFPTGSDCKGTPYLEYGPSDMLIHNVMGYNPDDCYWGFTNQQASRAHCWVCASLKNWVTGDECTL
eukprot:TRINITY_DN50_c0_g1_i3.p1 TRINITY_DN50_c0_g1~~TRINITY_DN50_c0_g1_i3.p1  ORF type:complete len:356 (+),score=83.73 TRINITY_DN50_c0_g1_i3:257-1324(+)